MTLVMVKTKHIVITIMFTYVYILKQNKSSCQLHAQPHTEGQEQVKMCNYQLATSLITARAVKFVT